MAASSSTLPSMDCIYCKTKLEPTENMYSHLKNHLSHIATNATNLVQNIVQNNTNLEVNKKELIQNKEVLAKHKQKLENLQEKREELQEEIWNELVEIKIKEDLIWDIKKEKFMNEIDHYICMRDIQFLEGLFMKIAKPA